jgi:hypothetical protein
LPASQIQGPVNRHTSAGRTALCHAPSPWTQFNVEFTPLSPSEDTAAEYLLPLLVRARANHNATWWFLRKPPGWRLRIHPAPAPTIDLAAELTATLSTDTTTLTHAGGHPVRAPPEGTSKA